MRAACGHRPLPAAPVPGHAVFRGDRRFILRGGIIAVRRMVPAAGRSVRSRPFMTSGRHAGELCWNQETSK